ncbi:MAG: hypothetical protein ABIA93_02765 [Candidatus Woesearchaeota archaeon]
MKASISIQFSWIFIFIVGAVMLIFFVSLVKNQEKQSDSGIAIDILQNLGGLIRGAEGSPDTLKRYTVPEFTYDASCEPGSNELIIGDGSYRMDLADQAVFSPRKIKGPILLAWTVPFEKPFRSRTLVYLTSSKVQYVFVRDGESYRYLLENISSSFPQGIDVKIVNKVNEVQSGYDKTITISIGDPNENTDVIILPHSGTNKNDDWGDLKIRVESGYSTLKYSSRAMLIGAIITGDAERYACNMDKILDNHARVAKVLKERAKSMSVILKDDPATQQCANLLGLGSNVLDKIITNAQERNIDALESNAAVLTNLNDDLARAGSCPQIY